MIYLSSKKNTSNCKPQKFGSTLERSTLHKFVFHMHGSWNTDINITTMMLLSNVIK